MPFTVDDFHDFIRLIETRPEWRTELRRLVLTDELLALPEQFTALVEAQQRTEVQLATLVAQVSALTRTVQTLTDDVGELKGPSLEALYRARGHAYFSRLLRRPYVLTSDELSALIEEARERGGLSEVDAQDLYETDLVVRGKRPEDGTEVFLIVEVSWGVGPYDVERAARRAVLFSHAGLATMAVVAGKSIVPEAVALDQRAHVWQLTDGQAIPTSLRPRFLLSCHMTCGNVSAIAT